MRRGEEVNEIKTSQPRGKREKRSIAECVRKQDKKNKEAGRIRKQEK